MLTRPVSLAVVTLVLGALFVQPSWAQSGQDGPGGREGPDQGDRQEERQKAREEARTKLFEALQITPDQQVQMSALLDTLQLERAKIMEEARSGSRDPELFRLIRADMAAVTKTYDRRLKEVLGEEKFAEYEALRAVEQQSRRGRRGGGGGREGRRGGGGGR